MAPRRCTHESPNRPPLGSADVIEIAELRTPAPRSGKTLVEVFASAVTAADWRLGASAFPGGLWIAGRPYAGLCRPSDPRRWRRGTPERPRLAQTVGSTRVTRRASALPLGPDTVSQSEPAT